MGTMRRWTQTVWTEGTSAEFLLGDVVDLLRLAAPFLLPPDDFFSIHGYYLYIAEDRSVLYVGDDAESFVDSPSKVQKVELFDFGAILFKKADGFFETELASGKR